MKRFLPTLLPVLLPLLLGMLPFWMVPGTTLATALATALDRAPASPAAPVILVLGDSLSAAYGMAQNEGWVHLLQQRLRKAGHPHRVVNASISGETSAGARQRIDEELARWQPDIVIIELGGNDGLRGLPLDALYDNLAALIEASLGQGARVLLLGMRLPPNYGRYSEDFAAVYAALARRYRIPLLPFLLAGMEDDFTFFQADGIHPNQRAQARILDNVWPVLRPLL